MSDEKKGKSVPKGAKALRNQQILAKAVEGSTNNEIAAELDLHRNTVSKVLNTENAKDAAKYAQEKLREMVGLALETVADTMKQKEGLEPAWPSALSAATLVLKNVGAIQDKLDLTHRFPKPTRIIRASGEEVILGSNAEKQQEEEEDQDEI